MSLLSSTAAFLALLLITSRCTDFTDGETETNLTLQSKVNDVREVREDVLEKRDDPVGTPLCGQVKVTATPINRGEDIVNNDDGYSYDDIDDNQHLDKIYGGTYVTYGEIPWQAKILYYNQYKCSGAIISEFWVLTAAQCIRGRESRFFSVTVGDHHEWRNDANEVTYGVNLTFHPKEYNVIQYDSDIALIKIKSKRDGRGIWFDSHVQPVCLPKPNELVYGGDQLTVSGWGKTASTSSPLLKKTFIYVTKPKFCWLSFTDRMLCAISNSTGVCEGDSGGPATSRKYGFVILQGVVSAGPACGSGSHLSMFAYVPKLSSWIETTIRTNSNQFEAIMPRRPAQIG